MAGKSRRGKKLMWLEEHVHRALSIYIFHLELEYGSRPTFSQAVEELLRRAVVLDRFISCAKSNPTNLHECYEQIIGDLQPILDKEGRVNIMKKLMEAIQG